MCNTTDANWICQAPVSALYPVNNVIRTKQNCLVSLIVNCSLRSITTSITKGFSCCCIERLSHDTPQSMHVSGWISCFGYLLLWECVMRITDICESFIALWFRSRSAFSFPCLHINQPFYFYALFLVYLRVFHAIFTGGSFDMIMLLWRDS